MTRPLSIVWRFGTRGGGPARRACFTITSTQPAARCDGATSWATATATDCRNTPRAARRATPIRDGRTRATPSSTRRDDSRGRRSRPSSYRGYLFAARLAIAEFVAEVGHDSEARAHRAHAAELRRIVEERFWLER